MKSYTTRYNHKDIEEKWLSYWERKGFFRAEVNPSKRAYTISMPPPNVTDILHLGHALNNTIQDIYIRWKRMRGYEALWVPGVDHASIATQVVVEKQLPEGKTKEEVGREKFLEMLWNWVEEKKDYILDQLKRLGCSADYRRTKFTLDTELSLAVREAFVRLYESGLIYRGDYVVNWCPRCQTALSNEEVEYEEEDGKLYYIKYPISKNQKSKIKNQKDDSRFTIHDSRYLMVATTRPETMLGDTALAVHPDDERYRKFIGSRVLLPLVEREIPVIADTLVDPKFGTGVVKVTPAHDANDFEIGNRNGLEKVIIMDKKGIINENGGKYAGISREDARKSVLKDLERKGLLEKTEPHKHSVGHCYRCHTVTEPCLSLQWFVKMKELAKPAIDAVEKGEIKFYPERWKNVYLAWMKNIRDWCISRQLWWGHPIPVYYCKQEEIKNQKSKIKNIGCGNIIIAIERPEKCPKCGGTNIVQDPDVLDTWFSSWLWPFSTLGWPEDTPDLGYFYPTDLLVTAPEIIFFWVARMIMGGYFFTGKPPFRDVYLHGTVRDKIGRKMSKSLGNGIDPVDIIEQYGTDALRFSILAVAGEGQDPHIEERTFELGRNFCNKLWNAGRLLEMLKREHKEASHEPDLADRWISSRLAAVIENVGNALHRYRLHEAIMGIYDFFWHEYCDFYLEIIKKTGHIEVGCHIFEKLVCLLHPFMPFITEELHTGEDSVMVSTYPKPGDRDRGTEKLFGTGIEIVTDIRNAKTSFGIPLKKEIPVYIEFKDLDLIKPYIVTLAFVREFIASRPRKGIRRVSHSYEIVIPLVGVVDVEKERAKIEKEIFTLERLIEKSRGNLSNEEFVKKADPRVVEDARRKGKEMEKKLAILVHDLREIDDSYN
ncbi:valine--tRNA ligase [candidate division WOR-3 bacterium JGI_Cruoil_03_44_89]|uniref:Valine--tRNA ligase n=1 Tax=candidate division WOR-3 bacterium JGI_Cruoil_03_44_89 TaxID=1973748 RepID=A0A235BQ79_UNCW3|nr:MAG: valine--tRNA ligase [candidate division WOR-3 bacterium JGI_Cruoil_03_44_89]